MTKVSSNLFPCSDCSRFSPVIRAARRRSPTRRGRGASPSASRPDPGRRQPRRRRIRQPGGPMAGTGRYFDANYDYSQHKTFKVAYLLTI
jgi:hypothetical protein